MFSSLVMLLSFLPFEQVERLETNFCNKGETVLREEEVLALACSLLNSSIILRPVKQYHNLQQSSMY